MYRGGGGTPCPLPHLSRRGESAKSIINTPRRNASNAPFASTLSAQKQKTEFHLLDSQGRYLADVAQAGLKLTDTQRECAGLWTASTYIVSSLCCKWGTFANNGHHSSYANIFYRDSACNSMIWLILPRLSIRML